MKVGSLNKRSRFLTSLDSFAEWWFISLVLDRIYGDLFCRKFMLPEPAYQDRGLLF